MWIKILATILLLCSITPAFSATYYVRTDGHDTNCNGTADASAASAPNCAWLTIQKGATTGTCGDTVTVGNGTYAERVTVADTCSSGTVFTLQAQNKWLAILNATTAGFVLTGNYITIDGFRVQGYTSASYYGPVDSSGNYNTIKNLYLYQNWKSNIYTTGTYNTISNNYFYNVQKGLEIHGTGHTVSGNEVEQLTVYEAGYDCDYIRYFGTGHTFTGNNLHSANLTACKADAAHVDCFQSFTEGGYGTSSNILIEKNICVNTHQGVNPSCTGGGCDTLTVRNNLFVGNDSYCVVSFDTTNVKAYNNTCVSTSGTCVASPGGCYGMMCESGSTCEYKNNIIVGIAAGQTPIGLGGTGAWITDAETNNLLYSIYQSYTQGYYPNDIVNQDPLFVGASDYQLQAGSPAINAGATIAGFTTDLLGYTRSGTWDIGAYEYGSGLPTSVSGCTISGGTIK